MWSDPPRQNPPATNRWAVSSTCRAAPVQPLPRPSVWHELPGFRPPLQKPRLDRLRLVGIHLRGVEQFGIVHHLSQTRRWTVPPGGHRHEFGEVFEYAYRGFVGAGRGPVRPALSRGTRQRGLRHGRPVRLPGDPQRISSSRHGCGINGCEFTWTLQPRLMRFDYTIHAHSDLTAVRLTFWCPGGYQASQERTKG